MAVFNEYLFTNVCQILGASILGYVTFVVGKSWWTKKNEEGKRDWLPFLFFFQMFFYTSVIVYNCFTYYFFQERVLNTMLGFHYQSLATGLIACAGVSCLAYIYRKEAFYYAPWFFYIGMIIFYLFTGWNELQFYFFLICAVIYVLSYYINGIIYKDNKLFGLGVFFTFPMIIILSNNTYVASIMYLIIASYGVLYANNKIKYFKDKIEIPQEEISKENISNSEVN